MCKQLLPLYVKTIRCVNGERLPTLMDRASGIPDFDATLWVVSSLRGQNLASATIEQALRSIIVLYLVFRKHKINLTKRLRAGLLLGAEECEAIAQAAKRTASATAIEVSNYDESVFQEPVKRIVTLEKFRSAMKCRNNNFNVSAETAVIRMGYIRAFLNWRTNREIMRAEGEKRTALIELRDLVDAELRNKIPVGTGLATLNDPIGIDHESQTKLLSIVDPAHPLNPWCHEFIRVRNQLIINMLLALGIRRGELLGLRIKDINPRKQEVIILRRPDDVNDPRLNEPNSKTRDRVLLLLADLYQLIKVYLLQRHEIVQGAHGFLFVANTGEPLSKSGLNRIFRALDGIPNLSKIKPHILRHTFCENLADDVHRAGKGDVEILGYLRRLGGWSDTSNTPRRYTKRFSQERANEAILSMQNKLLIKMIEE